MSFLIYRYTFAFLSATHTTNWQADAIINEPHTHSDSVAGRANVFCININKKHQQKLPHIIYTYDNKFLCSSLSLFVLSLFLCILFYFIYSSFLFLLLPWLCQRINGKNSMLQTYLLMTLLKQSQHSHPDTRTRTLAHTPSDHTPNTTAVAAAWRWRFVTRTFFMCAM